MAITKAGLKSAILADIRSNYPSSGGGPVAPLFYLTSIKNYIEANAEVTYNYTGISKTYPYPPDPNNGPAKAKLNLSILSSGAAVQAFLKTIVNAANPSGFVSAIMTDAMGTVVLQSPHMGTTATIYSLVSPVSPSISKRDKMEDCWDLICDAIVKSFLSLTPAPIATTTAIGAGTSTFVSIK